MFQLSIIVPSYQEEQSIEAFLSDLMQKIQSIDNVQVLVVDAGGDQTQVKVAEFAQKIAASNLNVIASGKGRAVQMNAGAEHFTGGGECSGQYFMFLHSDTLLPSDMSVWWRQVIQQKPQWGFFRVRLSGRAWGFRVIESMMNWRSQLTGVGTGDQSLFVSSATWQKVGGFKEIALMEDVELCKRLRVCQRPSVHAKAVTTSSRRWEKNGILRTVLLMWVLRFGYFVGVRPERLQRCYR